MNTDGTEVEQLTFGKNPKWSPRIVSKSEISFLEQRGKTILRYKLNLSTKIISPLPHPANCVLDDKNALYSPDGKQLLYQCKNDIFISDVDGKQPRNLTNGSNSTNFNPTWFPNGKKIAFTTDRDGNFEIYSMDLDGKNLSNLTKMPSNEDHSDVSPDGNSLLFTTNKDGSKNQEIYVMVLKNRRTKNVSNSPGWELIAKWNGSGSKILFGSNRDKNWEIYSYDLSTDTLKRLTDNSSFDGDPRFPASSNSSK